MDNSIKYEIPWELIADSVTGNLSVEGEKQLQQWFSEDPEHRKIFQRIHELWENGTESYRYYRLANENEGWKNLQLRMESERSQTEKPGIIYADFSRRRRFIRTLLAIASVCVGLAVIFWYRTTLNDTQVYSTGKSEYRTVSLEDGSEITLQPLTTIEIPKEYNKSGRTVIMISGEADFEVVHMNDAPFVVDLGATEVRDIGTSFIIRREASAIHVAVTSGKIAFIKTVTKESREVYAGSAISYNETEKEFGTIQGIETSGAFDNLLTFENTPLSDVIRSIQKVYARTVIINGEIADRRLTAKLYGMNFNSAIDVICTSLDLEYSVDDSIYTLQAKKEDELIK